MLDVYICKFYKHVSNINSLPLVSPTPGVCAVSTFYSAELHSGLVSHHCT